MKIAHMVSASVSYPLQTHNGRYEWVLRLAKLQAEAGLSPVIYSKVTSDIYIPGVEWRSPPASDDTLEARNHAVWQQALGDSDIDIYHSHFDTLHYEFGVSTTKPIVFTQHWFPDQKIADAAQLSTARNVLAVPITQYMGEEDKRLGIACAPPIYHGIDLELFRMSEATRSARYLFVGRITAHKGVRECVDLALRANVQLDIIGKLNKKDYGYWHGIVDKVDGTNIRYLGSKNQEEVAAAMQQARALLFPSNHIEAFGQTLVEAQACGTPVIATDIGANPELVIHGKTGFMAKTPDEFLRFMSEVSDIETTECRKQAEKFDIHRMVNSYTTLYEYQLNR